jgi:hypothetical protein
MQRVLHALLWCTCRLHGVLRFRERFLSRSVRQDMLARVVGVARVFKVIEQAPALFQEGR